MPLIECKRDNWINELFFSIQWNVDIISQLERTKFWPIIQRGFITFCKHHKEKNDLFVFWLICFERKISIYLSIEDVLQIQAKFVQIRVFYPRNCYILLVDIIKYQKLKYVLDKIIIIILKTPILKHSLFTHENFI